MDMHLYTGKSFKYSLLPMIGTVSLLLSFQSFAKDDGLFQTENSDKPAIIYKNDVLQEFDSEEKLDKEKSERKHKKPGKVREGDRESHKDNKRFNNKDFDGEKESIGRGRKHERDGAKFERREKYKRLKEVRKKIQDLPPEQREQFFLYLGNRLFDKVAFQIHELTSTDENKF